MLLAVGNGLDLLFLAQLLVGEVLGVAPGSEEPSQTHGDRAGRDLGKSRGDTMAVVASSIPESPAASAKGTVSPSDIPITTSRTASPAVKCFSMWGVCGIISLPRSTSLDHSILFAGRSPGVALEPVVAIIIPSVPPGQHAGAQVGREEERSPALDLADVGLLMVTKQVQASRVAAQDHVPQRHRVETDPGEEPGGAASMKLEPALPCPGPSTATKNQEPRQQAHQRGRKRPGVTRQPEQGGRRAPRDRVVAPVRPGVAVSRGLSAFAGGLVCVPW